MPTEQVGRSLHGRAEFIEMVHLPNLPEKGDVGQPDVRLRLNPSEVTGWVTATPRRAHGRWGRSSPNTARVVPTAAGGGGQLFEEFAPGVFPRLRAASEPGGINPLEEQTKRVFPQLGQADAIRRRMGLPEPTRYPSQRQIYGRLRHAGLGRRVVYDFQALTPPASAFWRIKAGRVIAPNPRG